jgi:hypothetical protein
VHDFAVISLVLALAWAAAAIVALRAPQARSLRGVALACAILAAAHAASAAWSPLAPLIIAAWFGYVLALPAGRLIARAACS